jgi:hypothetical protein
MNEGIKSTTTQGEAVDPASALLGDGFGGTVLESLVRVDKIVRDCEHSLIVAERLKARGRWQDKWDGELTATREKLASTLRKRDWLDGSISIASVALSSPNVKTVATEGVGESIAEAAQPSSQK